MGNPKIDGARVWASNAYSVGRVASTYIVGEILSNPMF